MPSDCVSCPFCDVSVTRNHFGVHLTSAKHLGEVEELLLKEKYQRYDGTAKGLPHFDVKGKTYSVCFGCKKGYSNCALKHTCSRWDAHCSSLKKLDERRAEADGSVEVDKDAMIVRLQKEIVQLKRQLSDEKAKGAALEASRGKNKFQTMTEEEMDAVDMDTLSEGDQVLYSEEVDRRCAEEKAAKKAAEEALSREQREAERLAVLEEVRKAAEAKAALDAKRAAEELEHAQRSMPVQPREVKVAPKAAPKGLPKPPVKEEEDAPWGSDAAVEAKMLADMAAYRASRGAAHRVPPESEVNMIQNTCPTFPGAQLLTNTKVKMRPKAVGFRAA